MCSEESVFCSELVYLSPYYLGLEYIVAVQSCILVTLPRMDLR